MFLFLPELTKVAADLRSVLLLPVMLCLRPYVHLIVMMMIAGTYMGGKEEFGVGSRGYVDAIFLLAEH